jgi:hypothetical protein
MLTFAALWCAQYVIGDYKRCANQADRVETLFTGALASIGLEILSEFFEPGIFGL